MEGLFQPMHLIIILVIVLVIFGPGKLPELGAKVVANGSPSALSLEVSPFWH